MKSSKNSSRPDIYRRSGHSIVNARIDHDALKIIARLKRAGFAAYIVGGGVRDLLLDKRPKDFDIATDATPKQVKTLFRNCRIIGRRFKLAHVYFRGNKIIEVSTFRDIAAESDDDSNSSEEYGVTLARDNVYGDERSDAIRRDLTINALFYDPLTQSIIDYVGGIKDLRAGIIKIIGDPDLRFTEDPVRMLRALRHAARTGFQIDEKCAKSMRSQHNLIDKCPAMRLFEELKKDLVSGYCLQILQLMLQHNLLEHFLPQFCDKSSSHIWEHNSYFIDTLANADSKRHSDQEISLTAILAIICLFSWNPMADKNSILGESLPISEINLILSNTFRHLAVPRKEKEKIALIIRDAQLLAGVTSKTSRGRRRISLTYDCNSLLEYLGLEEFIDKKAGSKNQSQKNAATVKRKPYRNHH